MHFILWEFKASPKHRRQFEREYGPSGAWAKLCRQSPDFLGIELLRSAETAGTYITIDRWTTAKAFKMFRRAFGSEYKRLDAKLENLTINERFIGEFDTCD